MCNSESKPPTLDCILKRIADEKALNLFNSIAITDGKPVLLRKSNLTSKQYYTRISGLMDAGLIIRHNSRYYSLTTLGKVVYESQMIIGKALSYYSRLKAIESIELSYGSAFPKEELAKLIDALIDNHQIRDMIMKQSSARSTKEVPETHLVRKKPNRH